MVASNKPCFGGKNRHENNRKRPTTVVVTSILNLLTDKTTAVIENAQEFTYLPDKETHTKVQFCQMGPSQGQFMFAMC